MSTLPTVFMFSGQGSHYYQMGRELFDRQPVFKQHLLRLDAVARDLLRESIVDVIYDPERKKMQAFDRTGHSHPAIFMVEMALVETLSAAGLTPDYVLGASLGSFAAATVAGCFSAEDALAAVIKQAEVLEQHCRPGAMTAVLAEPALYRNNPELHTNTALAAINFDKHFVISAPFERLQVAEQWLKQHDHLFQRLAVSMAFHSSTIDGAAAPYLDFIARHPPSTAKVPFACAMDAVVPAKLSSLYFWQVIRAPIRFQDIIAELEQRANYHYIDLSPSGTLATFLNYNLLSASPSRCTALITPYGGELEKLERLLAER